MTTKNDLKKKGWVPIMIYISPENRRKLNTIKANLNYDNQDEALDYVMEKH